MLLHDETFAVTPLAVASRGRKPAWALLPPVWRPPTRDGAVASIIRYLASPRDECLARRATHAAAVDRAASRALLGARVIAVLLVGWAAVAYQSCDRHRMTSWWLLAPTAAIVAVAVARGRALAAQRRSERAVRFHDQAIARIDESWADAAGGGARFRDDAHPYASDLDLFGERSLFGLLCTARLPIGQETLAAWLKAPAPPAVVSARQAAVAELAPRLALREALAVAADEAGDESADERSLLAWAEERRPPLPRGLRAIALLAALVGAGAVWAFASGREGLGVALALPVALFARACAVRTAGIEQGLHHRARELVALVRLVTILEEERFQAPALAALRQALAADGMRASARIARLARLVGWYESRRNAVQVLLTAPVLLGTQLALAIHEWRVRFGPSVARWLRAVGEIEALSSLAAFAHEHPTLPFPDIADDAAEPFVDGDEVGHPLIPSARRVCNPVRLGRGVRLLLVSGSNMSGKSTYLRTVGVNVALALAGAPVCARRLALSRIDLCATLRISDSLQAGHSRFYAEITRIRQAVVLAERSRFTLALLDEILHGTNSADRLLGARGIVGALVDAGALAIVTTHDLALAHLVDELGDRARNVHFEDRIDDGKLAFDYRMRDGVVTRTNALDLMRLVGLKV